MDVPLTTRADAKTDSKDAADTADEMKGMKFWGMVACVRVCVCVCVCVCIRV